MGWHVAGHWLPSCGTVPQGGLRDAGRSAQGTVRHAASEAYGQPLDGERAAERHEGKHRQNEGLDGADPLPSELCSSIESFRVGLSPTLFPAQMGCRRVGRQVPPW